jgi:hypothetical protein
MLNMSPVDTKEISGIFSKRPATVSSESSHAQQTKHPQAPALGGHHAVGNGSSPMTIPAPLPTEMSSTYSLACNQLGRHTAPFSETPFKSLPVAGREKSTCHSSIRPKHAAERSPSAAESPRRNRCTEEMSQRAGSAVA